jgi:hypothetical protein
MPRTGRPSKWDPRFVQQAFSLALLGLDDAEMAAVLGVSERTLNTWKHKHPEFLQSLKAGKDRADAQVAVSLYRRATGYEWEEEALVRVQRNQPPVIMTVKRKVPPDTTAAIFWLKNRQRRHWFDTTPQVPVTTQDPEQVARDVAGALQAMEEADGLLDALPAAADADAAAALQALEDGEGGG